MGKDLRWGLANQMLITCSRSLIYSLHKWNSLLDKNTENVGLGTVFLMMMSIKIFSYWKRLVIKKKKKKLLNSFSRIYLTGFTRRNTLDWGNRWGAIDGAEFMRVTPKLPKLPKLAGIRLIRCLAEMRSYTENREQFTQTICIQIISECSIW